MPTCATKYPVPIFVNPKNRSLRFTPSPGFIPAEELETLPTAEIHLFKSAKAATAFRIGVKYAGDENRHSTIAHDYRGFSAVLLAFLDTGDIMAEIDVYDHREHPHADLL